MRHTGMNAAPKVAAALRQFVEISAPRAAQISAFLECGAIIAWSDDCWIIARGRPEHSERPDPERASFFTPDFFLRDEKPWRIYPDTVAVSPDSLAQLLGGGAPERHWEAFDEDAFAGAFGKITEAFRAGRLQKAVPAVFQTSRGALTATERGRAVRVQFNLPVKFKLE